MCFGCAKIRKWTKSPAGTAGMVGCFIYLFIFLKKKKEGKKKKSSEFILALQYLNSCSHPFISSMRQWHSLPGVAQQGSKPRICSRCLHHTPQGHFPRPHSAAFPASGHTSCDTSSLAVRITHLQDWVPHQSFTTILLMGKDYIRQLTWTNTFLPMTN